MKLELILTGAPLRVVESAKRVEAAMAELEAAYQAYSEAIESLGGSPPPALRVSLQGPESRPSDPAAK